LSEATFSLAGLPKILANFPRVANSWGSKPWVLQRVSDPEARSPGRWAKLTLMPGHKNAGHLPALKYRHSTKRVAGTVKKSWRKGFA